ncbi:MAG TPA: AI-2E family transporter [Acidisarcina sp.]|nr:AI-2E family transporter [Acidisarcina sp.]
MNPPPPHRSARSNIVFAFALALALALAWVVRDVILLVYVSALFAVVLMPVVNWLMKTKFGKWHLSRAQSILLLLVLAISALILFVSYALPPIVRDLQEFTRELPGRMPDLIQRSQRIPFIHHLDLQSLYSKLGDLASGFATYVFHSIRNWAGVLASVLTGVVLTVYFMIEGEDAYRWALSLVPLQPRQRLDSTLRRAKLRMGKWLLGQGTLMAILGVFSTVVFLLLHIRYAYALGVVMGLFNIIPVAGALVSMAFVLLVASIDSWGHVVGALIFYVVWAQLENSYLIPKIMRSSVGLAGTSVLIALLLGAAVAGVAGALVAVPTAVLVTVLMDEYLVQRDTTLPDSTSQEGR